MKATFLAASVPLTKTFSFGPDGELKKSGHPRILDCTSHDEEFTTIEELCTHLKAHAAKGHSFLKGNVSRPIIRESRAGTTDANALTRVALFDLDGIKGVEDVEEFLSQLKLNTTDYIVQYSCSMGVVPDRGISAHIFMLLDREYAPSVLKLWLKNINLNTRMLRDNLALTRTNNALRWPLDVTTCQNDKLIYIAPPLLLDGVKDSFRGERIQLIKKKQRTQALDNPPTAEAIKIMEEEALNELRAKNNLPKRPKMNYKVQGTVEYLAKPDKSIVTGIKQERGYVYLNINGGDSWGYYHPENNPEFIFNFKNEPVYKTAELLPDYWAEVKSAGMTAKPDENGNLYLAFRDFKTGAYWNGIVAPDGTMELAQARSESQLKHFLKQYGQPTGEFIPDWNVVFNPHADYTVDLDEKIVNLFQPSIYMKMEPKPAPLPTMIHRVLHHVCGNDDDVLEHYLNWLAVIFQYRIRTMTGWVFHGTQGTGKGVMLHRILAPIFNQKYVISKRMEELESQFNGYMEGCFLLFIDEAQFSEYKRSGVMNASLKNYIVEPQISIRRMHTLPYMADNYLNLIFASNMPDPVQIDPEDRRFNVAAYQDKRLILSDEEFSTIDIELAQFAQYLMSRTADKEKARTPLNNPAKSKMILVSRNAIDLACDALLTGDFNFFWDQRAQGDLSALPAWKVDKATRYNELLDKIKDGKVTHLLREELHAMLDYTIGGMPDTPYKFSSYLKHHKIHIEPISRDGKTQRGLKVEWKLTDPKKEGDKK